MRKEKEGGGGENSIYTFLLHEHIEIPEGTDRMDLMINYPKTSVSILMFLLKKKHLNMIKQKQFFIEFHIHTRHPSFLAGIA